MSIPLHKLARTTQAARAEIAASRESVAALARRYNATEATIGKWRATTFTVMARSSPTGCLARGRQPSGEHEFDQLCQALGIEHRLTKPRAPQTNGMVERFNGRISDILKTHHFQSGEDLRATLHRYVASYHHQLPQAALGGKTPLQAMKAWFKSNPELFHRKP